MNEIRVQHLTSSHLPSICLLFVCFACGTLESPVSLSWTLNVTGTTVAYKYVSKSINVIFKICIFLLSIIVPLWSDTLILFFLIDLWHFHVSSVSQYSQRTESELASRRPCLSGRHDLGWWWVKSWSSLSYLFNHDLFSAAIEVIIDRSIKYFSTCLIPCAPFLSAVWHCLSVFSFQITRCTRMAVAVEGNSPLEERRRREKRPLCAVIPVHSV